MKPGQITPTRNLQNKYEVQEPSGTPVRTLNYNFSIEEQNKNIPFFKKNEIIGKVLTKLANLIIQHKMLPPNAPPLHAEKFIQHLINLLSRSQKTPFQQAQDKLTKESVRAEEIWLAIGEKGQDNIHQSMKVEFNEMLAIIINEENGILDVTKLARQLQKITLRCLAEIQLKQTENKTKIATPEKLSAASYEIVEKNEEQPETPHGIEHETSYQIIERSKSRENSPLAVSDTESEKGSINSIEEWELNRYLLHTSSSKEGKSLSDIEKNFSLINTPRSTHSDFENIERSPEEEKFDEIEERKLIFRFKYASPLGAQVRSSHKLQKLLTTPESYSSDLRNKFFKDTPINLLLAQLNKSSPAFAGNLKLTQIKEKLINDFKQQKKLTEEWIKSITPTGDALSLLNYNQQIALVDLKDQENNLTELYAELVVKHLKQAKTSHLDLLELIKSSPTVQDLMPLEAKA